MKIRINGINWKVHWLSEKKWLVKFSKNEVGNTIYDGVNSFDIYFRGRPSRSTIIHELIHAAIAASDIEKRRPRKDAKRIAKIRLQDEEDFCALMEQGLDIISDLAHQLQKKSNRRKP